MRLPVLLAALLFGPVALAASSSSLGPTNALRCYEESRMPLSSSGIRYCNDALRHDDLTRRDLAATHSNRGIMLAKEGKLNDAMADHNRAVELMPELAQAYVNRGNAHYHMRDFESALADFDRAIELGAKPSQVVHYNKALALIRLDRKQEARLALESALAFAPDSKKIKNRLADLEKL